MADQWQVDLDKKVARLGSFHIGFYELQGGGFSLATARVTDVADEVRAPLYAEAMAAIAQAFQERDA